MKSFYLGMIAQLVFMLMFTTSWCQTTTYIEYAYDLTGNRYQRRVVEINEKNNQSNVADSLNSDSISQNGQNENTVSLFTENIGEIKLSVFPNPTNGILTLMTNLQEPVPDSKMIIYNESGTLLTQIENIEPEQIIDLTGYATGVYFLKILIKDANKTFKIIKTNN